MPVGGRLARRERRDAELLRVGVVERRVETLAGEQQDEAVCLAGHDAHAGVGDRRERLVELRADAHAFGGRDPAGAAVGELAPGVGGGEVAARRDIAVAEVETEAERLEDAASDVELGFARIVAEERQVPGAAAGSDTGGDRDDAAERRTRCQRVEVRRARLLQRGPRLRGRREVANAVEHQEDDLRRVGLRQAGEQFEVSHGRRRRRLGVDRSQATR